MTARSSTTRARRRNAGTTRIPKWIAAWFAGERAFSFTAASPAHRPHIGEYWAAWKAEHPDATPPKNLHFFLPRS